MCSIGPITSYTPSDSMQCENCALKQYLDVEVLNDRRPPDLFLAMSCLISIKVLCSLFHACHSTHITNIVVLLPVHDTNIEAQKKGVRGPFNKYCVCSCTVI